ncbi:3-deoxy-D-manno-octulosonic acid transferase [Candidatus Electrothrix gigas]
MLYTLYRITGAVFYPLLVMLLPFFERFLPKWNLNQRVGRYGRYGRYQDVYQAGTASKKNSTLLWIHAASVGEVQAARPLITLLLARLPAAAIFLTTTTRQGRAVAQSFLPSQVRCELAPLDILQAVQRALHEVQPTVYICLETELWPVMLTEVRRAGIPLLLLNGRISAGSFQQYQRIKKTLQPLLAGFSAVGVIAEQDKERFCRLGLASHRIQVCGNMKYDLMQQNRDKASRVSVQSVHKVRDKYSRLLDMQPDDVVFICGSTRTGEEQLLLPVFSRLQEKYSGRFLWILAPRHLQRLSEVQTLLAQAGLGYELFSHFSAVDGIKRQENIILLNSMGQLAHLYALGDYIFCGGSLVDKGGHNIMEPIAQGKPVFFGPFMQDFQDAVDLVLSARAGVQVGSSDELADCLLSYSLASSTYTQACQAAERLAQTQQGAAQRQAEMVLQIMDANRV